MRRTIAPTTLVIGLATVFVLGILPRAQAGEPTTFSDQVSRDTTSPSHMLQREPPGQLRIYQRRNSSRSPAPFGGPFR